MRILIISTNALGDTYLSASSLEPIRKSFKSCEIHFVTLQSAKFFLDYLTTDMCYYLKRKNFISILELIFRIRRTKYDLTLSFFPGMVNSIFFYFSKSNKKAGFINLIKRNRWHNFAHKATVKGSCGNKFIWQPNMNYLERISNLLQLSGISSLNILKPLFSLENNCTPTINKNSVVIHFKARDKDRSISEKDIINLCNKILLICSLKINLIGIEKDFSQELIEECNKKNITIVQNPELPILLSYILNSKIFIGVDSFPLHMADAYNINFLGIFGPTSPSSVLVNSNKSIIFKSNIYLKINIDLLLVKIQELLIK